MRGRCPTPSASLLAVDRLEQVGLGHGAYVRAALAPGLVCIGVTLLVVLALHPYLLTSRYAVAPPAQAHDPVLLR